MYIIMLLKWRDAFRHRKRNDFCMEISLHFGKNFDFISENRRVSTLKLIKDFAVFISYFDNVGYPCFLPYYVCFLNWKQILKNNVVLQWHLKCPRPLSWYNDSCTKCLVFYMHFLLAVKFASPKWYVFYVRFRAKAWQTGNKLRLYNANKSANNYENVTVVDEILWSTYVRKLYYQIKVNLIYNIIY